MVLFSYCRTYYVATVCFHLLTAFPCFWLWLKLTVLFCP
uniref:Uncharacterized protein n=1 Tax=virus sp. ctLpa4 TaxID=2825814 RepID=A0A8S5RM82_9VIRU|nr:MAG TPA: hypothetical protein [virus sp. ctLpa4]DAP71441.1 MAG TPA: hypothetical protein [Caudoviricetes sp.]